MPKKYRQQKKQQKKPIGNLDNFIPKLNIDEIVKKPFDDIKKAVIDEAFHVVDELEKQNMMFLQNKEQQLHFMVKVFGSIIKDKMIQDGNGFVKINDKIQPVKVIKQ